jgi:hypothetical protein
MAIEKLKINYKTHKIKPGPLSKLKIMERTMNSD